MKRPARLARQVCPLCSRDDLIRVEVIGPSLWQLTCQGKRHPTGSFSWQSNETDRIDVPEGKTAELGLYEDLPRCLVPSEPFVEYGIVEHRFSELRPHIYQRLIGDYSHTRIEPKRYTASAFIASALGRLATLGDVLYRAGPATGRWSYDGVISYWALPPGPSERASTLTWKQFAIGKGLDPSK